MNTADVRTREVRDVIEGLIQEVSQNNVAHLDDVYHDDLQVIMLTPEDEVDVLNKEAMKGVVKQALEDNKGSVGTWVKFHDIRVADDTAHVLLSRKNELAGPDRQLTLGIDLKHEANRWQIVREVIVVRPATHLGPA